MSVFFYAMVISAAPFVVLACLISVFALYQHLAYFSDRPLQRCCFRIILMIPIYAILSYLSLVVTPYEKLHISLWFDAARDGYEAFVLYQFFRLLLTYLGGHEKLIETLEVKPPGHHPFPLCCLSFMPGTAFLHRVRQMMLQFVFLKPLAAIATIICDYYEVLEEGSFSYKHAYLYITLVDNVSITLAMWYLVIFYHLCHDELAIYRPLSKFLSIKGVVFFAFWQGVVIALVFYVWQPKAEHIPDESFGIFIQNWLVCIEMLFFAAAYLYAFGQARYKPHDEPIKHGGVVSMGRALFSCLNPLDTITDTYQSFAKLPPKAVLMGDWMELSLEEQRSRVVHGGWLDKKSRRLVKARQRRFVVLLNYPMGLAYFNRDPFAADAIEQLGVLHDADGEHAAVHIADQHDDDDDHSGSGGGSGSDVEHGGGHRHKKKSHRRSRRHRANDGVRPQAFIDFRQVNGVRAVPKHRSMGERLHIAEETTECEFELITKQRGWIFIAPDDETMHEWIRAIQASLDRLSSLMENAVRGDQLAKQFEERSEEYERTIGNLREENRLAQNKIEILEGRLHELEVQLGLDSSEPGKQRRAALGSSAIAAASPLHGAGSANGGGGAPLFPRLIGDSDEDGGGGA